jgi:hypothetical protein
MNLRVPVRIVWVALSIAYALGATFGPTARAADTTARTLGQSNCSAPSQGHSAEASYLAENNVAMASMMKDMAVRPSGDVDRDFVDMMVPHHRGAVDVAVAYLRVGRNETLRRLAQEIVVTQQQEIAAMKLAVHEPLPPPAPSPTGLGPKLASAGCSTARDSQMPPNMKMQ